MKYSNDLQLLDKPKLGRRFITLFLAASSICFAAYAQESDYSDRRDEPWGGLGLYVNGGVFGDFNLDGYDSAIVSRDARVGYQLEIGSTYFAVPVSFSTGQNVDIIGVKPRFQYLLPLGTTVISAGPGVGFVYNYWKSDLGLSGTDFSVTVHEIGVQPSVQVMIRPLPFLHIMVTPVAVDFNFWRKVEADAGIRGLGNFSTTNEDLGIIYSGGVAVGFNF